MKTRTFLLIFLLLSFLATACGVTNPTVDPTVEATSTPDPCAPENIKKLLFLATACGVTNPTVDPTVEATSTPDPCAPENIKAEVEEVHRWMREFDDASVLAANTPREQLNPEIAALQAIRRAAEDQAVPVCLRDLKAYQLNHMNTVINTLISFIEGTADQETINQGIAHARQQHDQYALEIARLLGITIVTNTPPPGTATP